jgi:hypothetical protein
LTNAAELYREAFARLPDGALDEYTRRLGREDSETYDFVERGRHALDLLHQAARCAECDWGSEAALGVPVEDFSGARRLAMLAVLRAEVAIRRDEKRAALDDLAALIALARQLGCGKYVSALAGFAIEDLAVTKALDVLKNLDPANCCAFAKKLDSLPPVPRLSDAVRAEQAYFRMNYREKFSSLDEQDVSRPIREAFGLPAPAEGAAGIIEIVFPDGDPAEAMLIASGGTRSGLLALADEVLAALDTLAAIVDHPEKNSSVELNAIRGAAGSNPLLRAELRAFDRVKPLWERLGERFVQLRSLAAANSDRPA